MTPPDERASKRRLLLDLSPFRESRAFGRLWAGTALGSIGQEMTVVTVALQVYAITSSTFAVSLIAGIALGPIIITGLYGGTLADRFDRRRVAMYASVISWLAIIVLAVHAVGGGSSLVLLYAAATVNSAANTVGGITRRAIVPRLLPSSLLPAAGALNGINLGLMATVGPLVGTTAVGLGGFASAYLIDVVLHTFAFLGVFTLPALRASAPGALNPWQSVRDGVAFLRGARNVRFGLTLDLIAMGLAQPRVLFPALGAVTLGGGVTTVGVLSSASAAGTVLSAFFSGWTGSVRRQGRAILIAAYVYGASIAAAGVVIVVSVARPHTGDPHTAEILVLASVLAIGGAADSVSAIFRMAMLQAAVPDQLRGRVQSLFTLIVTGGPRVGDVVTGTVASLATIASPLLAGGLAMTLLTWVLARRIPSFRHYDSAAPQP